MIVSIPLSSALRRKQTAEECQLLPTPFIFCHLDHVLSPLLSAKMRLAGEIVSRVNNVKRIKIGGRWKMFSIPRNAKGNYDWNAIADGGYYVEW
jgi:hypothetical protein